MIGMATKVRTRQSQVLRSVAALVAVAFMTVPVVGQDVDAYFASFIWTGDGEPVRDGVMVVRDGTIVEVGPRGTVDIPAGAKRHELGSANLIPGLVVAQTNVVESTQAEEYAISPEVRAADGFDAFGDYEALLAAGVTTIQISPGDNRLMPGQGAVVKLAGDDPLGQILSEVESLRIILTQAGLSPPTVYEPPVGAVSVERPIEPTKPQLATSLSQALVGLRALLSEAHDADAPEDLRLQALADIVRSHLVTRWTAGSNAEVKVALELSSEFELPWILVDPIEVDLLDSKELWASKLARGVILNPELRPGRITNPAVPREGAKVELPVWERARRLLDAGAGDRLALRSATDQDLSKLLYTASVLGRGGFTSAQILKTLTSNPAQMLGVADRVGSLKPKADADFVVLSGTPFEPGTQLLATYVGGESVFESESKSEGAAVIHAAQIYSSSGVLQQSSVAVAGGKIAGLGSDVSLPKGASVRDFGNAVIIPGMIDCSTSLGLGGSLGDNTPFGKKLGALLARNDDQVALGRKGGVTTALLSSTRLPSPVLAFKLTDLPRPLKDPVALRFEIDGNLTAAEASVERTLRTGKAYADSWTKYDGEYAEYKKKLAAYEAEKAKYDAAMKAAAAKKAEEEKKKADNEKADTEKANADDKGKSADKGQDAAKKDELKDGEAQKEDEARKENEAKGEKPADGKSEGKDAKPGEDKKPAEEEKLVEPKKPEEPKKPRSDDNLEPYRDLFAKKLVAMVDVSEVKAVELAVKLFRKDFDIKTAIVAGEAAARRAELLAENDVFVVVGPTLVGTDEEGELVNYAAELAIGQVPIGFQSRASTGVSELPTAISYAVYEGLGQSDALNGLTSEAATFFGLDSVGGLEVGKDADLVVLSGSPLLLSTEVLAVMIDGEWVYEKESN